MIRTATLSKFFYRLNAGQLAGDTIPLGAVALLPDDEKAGSYLVLLARSSLLDTERRKMDWTAATILANPLEYLKREVDALLEKRVGSDLFERLSQRLTWSIYVSPPNTFKIPDNVAAELGKAMDLVIASPHPATDMIAAARRERHKAIPPLPVALARLAGPEFAESTVGAYVPPAWMVAAAATTEYQPN